MAGFRKPLYDLTGQKFGRLTALRLLERRDACGRRLWLCACDCGGTIEAHTSDLRRLNRQSCGCLRRGARARVPDAQQRCASLRAEGRSVKEIARLLGYNTVTVYGYLKRAKHAAENAPAVDLACA